MRETEGILVTGGAGFVGSHIVEALLKRSQKVIILDLFNQETTKSDEKQANVSFLKRTAMEVNEKLTNKYLKAELHVITGDICNRNCIEDIINNSLYNITSVVHTAGMVDDRRSVSYPNEYFDVNIKGTATLLDVLGKSGKIKRVIQTSTRSVFGEVENQNTKLDEFSPRRPVNPYGVSKVAADALAHCYSHMYQMQIFLIRITSCYGHRGRPDMILRILMENIESGSVIKKFGTGEATRTWLYIDDIVDCFMKALFFGLEDTTNSDLDLLNMPPLSLYEEFNTGSKEGAVTLNQVIETAQKVIGKKANIQEIKEVPKGDAKFIGVLDYSKAKSVLGWEPRYDLEQGMIALKKYYEDIKAEKKNTSNRLK